MLSRATIHIRKFSIHSSLPQVRRSNNESANIIYVRHTSSLPLHSTFISTTRMINAFHPPTERRYISNHFVHDVTPFYFIRIQTVFSCEKYLPLVRHNERQHYIWFGILPNHTTRFRKIFSDKRVYDDELCTAIVSR
jgi:hypothetical protein